MFLIIRKIYLFLFRTHVTTFNTMVSFLGRVMYNYANKYYITASLRADGSSRFPAGNKYALFPSASASWRITSEEFMEDQEIFSDLKLRGGWGRVGNQNIANDATFLSSTYKCNFLGADNKQ